MSSFPITRLPQEIFEEIILYAAMNYARISPELLRNLRLVNKDFNRAGTRFLFRDFNASIEPRSASSTTYLSNLWDVIEAGYGLSVRKLRIGNTLRVSEPNEEDVSKYMEGFVIYDFPWIFPQLTGLQSLHIEHTFWYRPHPDRVAEFVDVILAAFEATPPRLQALSISYDPDGCDNDAELEQLQVSPVYEQAMPKIMPQIRYLRIDIYPSYTTAPDLIHPVDDSSLSPCDLVRYGENLRYVELGGLSDARDVSLCQFHPRAPLQHVVLRCMHASAPDMLRFLWNYRSTLTVVTLSYIELHDGTWKEVYEELDALPFISQWKVVLCTPPLRKDDKFEVRSGPGNQEPGWPRDSPLIFW